MGDTDCEDDLGRDGMLVPNKEAIPKFDDDFDLMLLACGFLVGELLSSSELSILVSIKGVSHSSELDTAVSRTCSNLLAFLLQASLEPIEFPSVYNYYLKICFSFLFSLLSRNIYYPCVTHIFFHLNPVLY